MSVIVHTNDWHIAAKNPASRTDDYNGELFDLLNGQVLRGAIALKAEAIANAGDTFHDKHPSSRLPLPILYRVVQFANAAQRAGIVLPTIPGNHDELQDNYHTLPGRPLGLLFEAGMMTNVSHTRLTLRGGTVVYGVPWPHSSQPDAFEDVPADVDVVLAHAFATPEGGDVYGEHVHKYDDLAKAAPHVRIWHFGHDHTDHGVYTLRNGAKVINVGALSRGVNDYDTLTRRVKIAVSDVPARGPATVQVYELNTVPADRIFDLKLHARKVQESKAIEAFVQQLRLGLDLLPSANADAHVRVLAALDRMVLTADVRQSVHDYITKAEASVS